MPAVEESARRAAGAAACRAVLREVSCCVYALYALAAALMRHARRRGRFERRRLPPFRACHFAFRLRAAAFCFCC